MRIPHATTTAPGSRQRARGSTDGFPGDPLDQLVEHLRRHPRIDGGAFLVVDHEGGRVRPAASWFASPVLGAAMQSVMDRPYAKGGAGFTEATLERGRPLFLPRVEDWEAAEPLRDTLGRAGDDLGDELWTAYVRASVIACPVRSGVGRIVGALEVASFDPGRPLTRDDLGTIEVMADLAAVAYERTAWLEQETERARVELELKRAAAAVSGSLETDEVLNHLVVHTTAAVSAVSAMVSKAGNGGRLDPVAYNGPGGAGFEVGQVAEVARARSARRFGGAVPSAHVPIDLGPRLFGVLSASRPGGPEFSEWEVEVLQRLARSSAAALANADHFESERRLSRALTRGFVPDSLPLIDDFEAAALYEPSGGQTAGGDIYGLWRRPGDELLMLIGDVAGKGQVAAGTSAMVRFFVESRAWDGAGPGEVLSQVGAMLARRLPDDSFVTAFLAVFSGDGLVCANAGHLPPLVSRAGRPSFALGARGLPLGIECDARYDEERIELSPGDLLYAYTDGLTEARHEGEMFGEDRLRVALDHRRQGPGRVDAVVESVHETVRTWAGTLVDDSTALAVQRR